MPKNRKEDPDFSGLNSYKKGDKLPPELTELARILNDPNTIAQFAEEERKLRESDSDPLVQFLDEIIDDPLTSEAQRSQLIGRQLDRRGELIDPVLSLGDLAKNTVYKPAEPKVPPMTKGFIPRMLRRVVSFIKR